MNLLFIGDVVGKPGRTALQRLLKDIQTEYAVDFTICNCENAAGGNGITKEVADELYGYGINCLTSGNHIWDQRQVFEFIEHDARLVRPANYPIGTPGKGFAVLKGPGGVPIAIANFSGRIFMPPIDDPFLAANKIVTQLSSSAKIIFVDFHAEATSEKIALGWFLDGRVSAVCGTHTHVQTADERVLPAGTAYISDVGMTGPKDSVLGVKKEVIIKKFLTGLPARFETAGPPLQLNAVLLTVDATTGKAEAITRIQKFIA
ncbi:MAG: TIGR00282 family metallophosphoesterase [Peptococcaceae bacterium]|nr:TIGR00282 family metallophosphoesterase [Peptococcaceae bacterium]